LEEEAKTLLAPDLRVDRVNAPQQAIVNAPFTIEAVIREFNGQVGATAVVTLSEGATVLGTVPNVFVDKGNNVSVAFEGISAATAGTHTYSVTISNAYPSEYDTTNNSFSFSIVVIAPTPMQYAMTYFYERTQSRILFTSNYGYNSLDSTYAESASLNYGAYVSTMNLPSSPIDQITWKIETPAGTFDQSSFSNVARSSGDQNTDYYVLSNVNNKNIDFTLTVDRLNGFVQASITQFYSLTVYIFRDPSTSIETRILTGDSAYVLAPDSTLSVTLQINDGGNSWGGEGGIVLSPILQTITSSSIGGSSVEDGTSWSQVTSYNDLQASGAGTGTTGISGLQKKMQAVKLNDVESFPSTSLPRIFSLGQNYPNPFNPSTTIEFSLPRSSHVTLKVYDMLAREVATLVDQNYPAGVHQVRWNAAGVASGMYVYRLSTGSFTAEKKLILLK
jgi:hypothetical protein